MAAVLADIRSGAMLAERFIADQGRSGAEFRALRAQAEAHPIGRPGAVARADGLGRFR